MEIQNKTRDKMADESSYINNPHKCKCKWI